MRYVYFDCFSGAAGDMILGALVDAGVDVDHLRDVVRRLKLPGVTLQADRVRRGGLAATHLRVELGPEAMARHRHLPEILDIIAAAELPAAVTQSAERIFRRLAEAEAGVHGIPVEKVHFHEVGAADAIVDIVGAAAGLAALEAERIGSAPIPPGSGTVKCAHGTLPVPAPATARLLQGVPLAQSDLTGELTTPTGAAVLTTLADSYGPLPAMQIAAIGYGAGTREYAGQANVLRVLVGSIEGSPPTATGLEADTVTVLETQLDDVGGQVVAHVCERLLATGALDAYVVPIVMKKSRPGQLVTVLCRNEDAARMEDILLRETTTFGVRRHTCDRHKLAREHQTVETRFGHIRVKLGMSGGQVLKAWPEYEDCAATANEHGVALRSVQDAALAAWMEQNKLNG